jgi:hypothetical protein
VYLRVWVAGFADPGWDGAGRDPFTFLLDWVIFNFQPVVEP